MSIFGLVWDVLKRFLTTTSPINGQVLLFLRPPDRHHQILYVFLLPDNIPLEEVKAKQEEAVYIRVLSDCNLITNRSYSVHCDEASRIQPEHKEFRQEYGPNFFPTFEVVLPINQEEVTLMVKDQEGRPVWKHVVYLTGPGLAETPSDPAETKLNSVREQFVDRVSEANLHKLLDKLLQRGVINNGEMEFAGTPTRADKARQVIDVVRGKGTEASSALIAALCEVDPCLSKELNLQ
ncbi:uncharacterized protein LOC122972279 [Thunnus albacares]|uniref:uncharacterized protein LOC122972279 n=1 Tax=Thunnus albacares TaxID=8236 RepID=UPI001CF661C4|nr:uncharacterized protein LOC122972279 [Thunnus albacares]XP_044195215.1 uncharacterized protein LOC122972279 [Thunnus albacares]